jgi:hypothetical protein
MQKSDLDHFQTFVWDVRAPLRENLGLPYPQRGDWKR